MISNQTHAMRSFGFEITRMISAIAQGYQRPNCTPLSSIIIINSRNTTVGLEHVETPADMKMWPLFHNGVATGLRIAQGISQV